MAPNLERSSSSSPSTTTIRISNNPWNLLHQHQTMYVKQVDKKKHEFPLNFVEEEQEMGDQWKIAMTRKHRQQQQKLLHMKDRSITTTTTTTIKSHTNGSNRRTKTSSRSIAASWPPPRHEEELEEEEAEEQIKMSSSWKEEKKSFMWSRPPPPMTTLFESATIYTEDGARIRHEDFLHGTSLEKGMTKKQHKRRLGRKKYQHSSSSPCLSPLSSPSFSSSSSQSMVKDQIVMELMSFLLPQMDVTKELNTQLLLNGNKPVQVGVFDFEEEEEEDQLNVPEKRNLIDFQKTLHQLVFHTSKTQMVILVEDTGGDFFTKKWIFDTLCYTMETSMASMTCFDILLQVFCVFDQEKRLMFLNQIKLLTCLLYEQQGIKRKFTRPAQTSPLEQKKNKNKKKKTMNLKGLVCFLKDLVHFLQQEKEKEIEKEEQEQEQEQVEYLSILFDCLKFLLKTSPTTTSTADTTTTTTSNSSIETNLDIFQKSSSSIEATTYTFLGELIHQMTLLSPCHGIYLLEWMITKWPSYHVQLDFFYLKFLSILLIQFGFFNIQMPSFLLDGIFQRLEKSIKSTHFLISKEAMEISSHFHFMHFYLMSNPKRREQIASALYWTSIQHWNQLVREKAEEKFDLLLDFA